MKGFTLIETLIAVTILSLAVVGPLYSVSRSLSAAQNASNQLTASYLAQEGVEYVRRVRDNAFLASYQANDPNASTAAWTNFLSAYQQCNATNQSTKACTLDATTVNGLSNSSCTIGDTCTPLYLAGGIYTQSAGAGVKQPYTRTVQFFNISTTDERIVSKVTWDFHGTAHTVTVTAHLTPWQ